MASKNLEQIKLEIVEKYKAMTPKSRELFEESQKWLPGGGTRNITYFYPYPFYVTKGEGIYLEDIDGNRYIDIQNNMTAQIHGHANPKMTEVMQQQASLGTAHNAPTAGQYELAKMICERIPSIEEIRFCNSGTEATMFTLRAARVFTGKDGIILADGCYHGSHDYVSINHDSALLNEGMPKPTTGKGVPKRILKDIYIVPYNDLSAAEKIMKRHHKKIAAMIIEPIMVSAGAVAATPEYLKGLRELTKKYGILLIFDEVITFRISTGGMQKLLGIKPDLTALGKIIGGGLPIGAFGGRREIMEQFNPTRKDFIMHSGTFSGNAMLMSSGKAALELYNEAEVERLGKLGDRMRKGLREIMDSLDISCYIGGIQSLTYIQFPNVVAKNKKELSFNTIPYLEFSKYVLMALVINGLYGVSKGVIGVILSTAMNEELVDEVLVRFRKTMEMVQPIYEDIKPYQGFAGIIYSMFNQLNTNEQFAKGFSQDNYSILLVAKDDPNAIKLDIKDGKIAFTPIKNIKEEISKVMNDCHGTIITTRPTFLGLGLGKVKPLKAILAGRLKIKGIKYIQKFTKYFSLLRIN
ncbi:MAG: aminotransferase class III-fold pyridoxal phosphate-dependent enzyme [Candidatus Heimdallarchaeota archaeon]|nr:aminotransferase class III-fold pyridoxal phosphate-dependent enzyme [Candidatus Heimdallarchaeota archaeon]